MWMYQCFDGDDMDIALAQHDLYFGRNVPPGYGIAGRYYTLGWWWHVLLEQAARQRLWIPWLNRHWQRLQGAGEFSHKLLQLPHEHIAAFYRWQQRGCAASASDDSGKEARRLQHLAAWRDWVRPELEDLMSDGNALLATAKLILYRQFDASDRAGEELDRILVGRYGMECVTATWRAKEPMLVELDKQRNRYTHQPPREGNA